MADKEEIQQKAPVANANAVPEEKPLVLAAEPAAEPAPVPAANPPPSTDEAYSVFTTTQKKAIVLVASLCSFLSPLTGSIYYPALTVIARDYHVSNTAVNLTVTTYLILQGIAPTFIAGFADGSGRRPAYFICFVVYIAANIGLGAQHSYAALLVLRMVQSAGSSGTVALATGIAADVVSAAERGSYISLASLGAWLGPILGPVIGGLISHYLGWHWIFWFLTILSGVAFILMMLFFPETNRNLVGDGSYPPPPLCKSLTNSRIVRNQKRRGVHLDPAKQEALRRNYKLVFPNPFATLIMAFDKACIIILVGNGLVVGNMYAVPVGVSELFSRHYGYNQIQVALCYLPFGAGAVAATFIFGKMLDRSYRKHAIRLGFPVVRNRRQDLGNFPIERARFDVGLPVIAAGMAVTIAYGWVLAANTNVAGPLVLSFFIGLFTTGSYQVVNTLMVDNFPERAATAMAANNLFRCLMGAGATAAVGPMLNAWGAGWTYTFFALLWLVFSPACFLLIKKGPQWRGERKAREEVKQKKKVEREGARMNGKE